jgi:hypothetical protein
MAFITSKTFGKIKRRLMYEKIDGNDSRSCRLVPCPSPRSFARGVKGREKRKKLNVLMTPQRSGVRE